MIKKTVLLVLLCAFFCVILTACDVYAGAEEIEALQNEYDKICGEVKEIEKNLKDKGLMGNEIIKLAYDLADYSVAEFGKRIPKADASVEKEAFNKILDGLETIKKTVRELREISETMT